MFWNRRVYLDEAAGVSGNSSSPHTEGRAAKEQLEAAREKIARLLEVKADDVVFTSGATEANAIAILGTVRSARNGRRNNAHALYLPSAHASVVENMQILRDEGVIVESLPIKDSRVDVAKLETMLTPNTVLVSMDAVCGETGVVWNTREVADVLGKWFSGSSEQASGSAQAARPILHPAGRPSSPLLHVDASQAPRTEKLTRSHFGADLLTLDSSKVSSLRGFGALVAHRTIAIEPLYRGGGQERGLRSGSASPEAAQVFANALEQTAAGRAQFVEAAKKLRTSFVESLSKDVPEALVNEGKEQAPNILNLSLPGMDTDYLVALLDEAGFATSTRSACEKDSLEGSRAVLALTGDRERAMSTIRVSWGPEIRPRDLTRFVFALKKALEIAK